MLATEEFASPDKNHLWREPAKKLALYSTSLVEEPYLLDPLGLQNFRPLAPVNITTDFIMTSVSVSTSSLPDIKISGFERSGYRADVLNADCFARIAGLTSPNHFEQLSIMLREGRWVTGFLSFSVAEKNLPSNRLLVPLQMSKADLRCLYTYSTAFATEQ